MLGQAFLCHDDPLNIHAPKHYRRRDKTPLSTYHIGAAIQGFTKQTLLCYFVIENACREHLSKCQLTPLQIFTKFNDFETRG